MGKTTLPLPDDWDDEIISSALAGPSFTEPVLRKWEIPGKGREQVIDIRIRSKISKAELDRKIGKVLGPEDYNLLLTGPTRVRMPDNRPLCVYLPGVLTNAVDAPEVYEILSSLKTLTSNNRGLASGTPRFRSSRTDRTTYGSLPHTYTKPVASALIGAMDPAGQRLFCRLTAWTGKNMPSWEKLNPLFREIAEHQRREVPARAAAQQAKADASDPAWIVPGTPFSTITVNNTYSTGVHTDKGDLDEGFSSITVLRRGEFTGAHLVFPEYRVGVDLQHGDLLLMDAHQYHGNTTLTCACGDHPFGPCKSCGAERISLVSYFRTGITQCGSPAEELRRADRFRDQASSTG